MAVQEHGLQHLGGEGHFFQWMGFGFVGKIFTGKTMGFLTIKLIGVSGFNFPIIQFYDLFITDHIFSSPVESGRLACNEC